MPGAAFLAEIAAIVQPDAAVPHRSPTRRRSRRRRSARAPHLRRRSGSPARGAAADGRASLGGRGRSPSGAERSLVVRGGVRSDNCGWRRAAWPSSAPSKPIATRSSVARAAGHVRPRRRRARRRPGNSSAAISRCPARLPGARAGRDRSAVGGVAASCASIATATAVDEKAPAVAAAIVERRPRRHACDSFVGRTVRRPAISAIRRPTACSSASSSTSR